MQFKHSGFGISSLIISSISGIAIFVIFVVAAVMEVSTPGGIEGNPMGAIIVGSSIIGMIILSLLALGLGICGLFQKERKKIFPIIGTVFSSFTVLSILSLMIVGS